MMRVRGHLTPAVEDHRLENDDVQAIATAVLPTGHRETLKEQHEVDFAYSVAGLGRFPCNTSRRRGTIGMIFRVIPLRVLTIDDLTPPVVLKRIAAEERGLVLVTGMPGSDKSTILPSMIDEINSTRTANVMTVEDPIEYLHRDNRSIINQHEIGLDTMPFSLAPRSALRQGQGQDVILVGEMRDFETIETALLAADTGHLVFSTLHTRRRDRDRQPHHRGFSSEPSEADSPPARQRPERRHIAAPDSARRRHKARANGGCPHHDGIHP
jgi:twitching motility protein PilT